MNLLKKRILSIFIAFCLAMPLGVFADSSSGFKIKIVHTNDIHARVQENEKSGIIGVEKLGGVIDSYKEGADMDLVLDSGDLFHGQPIATISRGESIAELIKACGYDAMTVGNHDWSYGKDRVSELCDIADVAMLAGNVLDTKTGKQFFKQEFYTESVKIGKNELKVGIFGVMDPDIKRMTAPSNVEGLTFSDSAEYANKAAKELKKQDCDIVIALAHTYSPKELAQKVSGVDLWLAGHEHMCIDEEVSDSKGKTTRVVESGYYLYSLSLIELSGAFDAKGKAQNLDISVSTKSYAELSDYAKKDGVTATLNEIKEKQSETLNVKVGETPEALDGVWEDLRIYQQNIGNVITDAYLLETGADVAFENAGGIRSLVEKGDVTYGDIIGISPYGNYIVTKAVSGAELKEIMETSLEIQSQCIVANDSGEYDSWPESSGSHLQFGGMKVVYAPDNETGNRVLLIEVNGEPLDLNKNYTVATNNFIAVSSYYPQLAKAEEIGHYAACDDALIKFFAQDGDSINISICEKRLFTVSQNGAALVSASLTESVIYSVKACKAAVVASQYDDNGALIAVIPQFCKINSGINTVNTDFGGFSQGIKFVLLAK